MDKDLYNVTAYCIGNIYNEHRIDFEALAALRNSDNILSPKAQAVWPLILENLNSKFLSKSTVGNPSYAQNAVFAALRAFALMQQSNNSKIVYGSIFKKEGIPLFSALGQARDSVKSKDAFDRRANIILSSANFELVVKDLISMEQIMKASGVKPKIDYALLASDLYSKQFDLEESRKISLKWGQQYFRNVYSLGEI